MTDNELTRPDDTAIGRLNALTPDAGPACIHNFDGDPRQQWLLSTLATGDDVADGEKCLGVVMPLKYWYCHLVTVTTDTGDEVTQPRVVLITDKHDAYGFVSQGIFDYLRLLVHHMGEGPYDPPLLVAVKQIKTRRGFRYYTLEPAPPDRPARKRG